MAKISVRQICFILIAYTAASKILFYPQALADHCGRDLLFSAALEFLLQGVVIWSVAYLASRTDKTFFELLRGTIGEVGARIVYGLFAAFFILCSIVPLFEQKLYVHAIFYDAVPSLVVFLPFFIFAVYAGSKGFENIGRCADICLPLFLASMAFVFAMSFGEVKPEAFLPVFKTPLRGFFGGTLGAVYRFAEPCYLLMFLGHFKYKKGDAAKMTLSYAAGAVIVLLVLFVFYGIYGDISGSRQFAISKISLFFPAIEVIGRIDLIALYVLEVVMLFALVLNIQLAVHCICKCCGWEERGIVSLAVNAVLASVLFIFDNKFVSVLNFYFSWAWIIYLVFAYAAPLLCWTLRRKNETS